MNKIIYHTSKIPGLKILEPHLCAHNIPYVYASYHIETSLLFGGELWSDWDFRYKRNYETGELTFSETYKGAFDKTFANKSCYLYEIEDSGFLEGQTNMWDEIVSTQKTKVLKETYIKDLAEELIKLSMKNLIKIEKFENFPTYKQKIEKHIKNLKKYSDVSQQKNAEFLIEEFNEWL